MHLDSKDNDKKLITAISNPYYIDVNYGNYTWNIKYVGEAKFTALEIILAPR